MTTNNPRYPTNARYRRHPGAPRSGRLAFSLVMVGSVAMVLLWASWKRSPTESVAAVKPMSNVEQSAPAPAPVPPMISRVETGRTENRAAEAVAPVNKAPVAPPISAAASARGLAVSPMVAAAPLRSLSLPAVAGAAKSVVMAGGEGNGSIQVAKNSPPAPVNGKGSEPAVTAGKVRNSDKAEKTDKVVTEEKTAVAAAEPEPEDKGAEENVAAMAPEEPKAPEVDLTFYQVLQQRRIVVPSDKGNGTIPVIPFANPEFRDFVSFSEGKAATDKLAKSSPGDKAVERSGWPVADKSAKTAAEKLAKPVVTPAVKAPALPSAAKAVAPAVPTKVAVPALPVKATVPVQTATDKNKAPNPEKEPVGKPAGKKGETSEKRHNDKPLKLPQPDKSGGEEPSLDKTMEKLLAGSLETGSREKSSPAEHSPAIRMVAKASSRSVGDGDSSVHLTTSSFRDAAEMAGKLQRQGVSAQVVRSDVNGKESFRVVDIGSIQSRADAGHLTSR